MKEPWKDTTPPLLIQLSGNPNDQSNQSNKSKRDYRNPHLSVDKPRPELKNYVRKKTFVLQINIIWPLNKFCATRGAVKFVTYSVTVPLRFLDTVKDIFPRILCPIRFHSLIVSTGTAYLNQCLIRFVLRKEHSTVIRKKVILIRKMNFDDKWIEFKRSGIALKSFNQYSPHIRNKDQFASKIPRFNNKQKCFIKYVRSNLSHTRLTQPKF